MAAGFAIGHLHSDAQYKVSEPVRAPANPWPEIDIGLAEPQPIAIAAWRVGINAQYQEQLGHPLEWNEASSYRQEIPVANDVQIALYFAAALIDLYGSDGGLAKLRDFPALSRDELATLRGRIDNRGYLCRFPQILLQVDYWFPFERDFIIEANDWAGKKRRFGSLFALRQESIQLVSLLETGGAVAAAPGPVRDQALACAKALAAMAAIAIDKKLPLWRV